MKVNTLEETLDSVTRKHLVGIIALLKRESPEQAALSLEREGWPREWACAAIAHIETKHNPAGLVHGSVRNQELREKLQTRAALGGAMFVIGLLVSLGTLVSALYTGGWIVIAYGAVFTGAGMWLQSFPLLKKYPDRRMPVYVPPKDPKDHNPNNY